MKKLSALFVLAGTILLSTSCNQKSNIRIDQLWTYNLINPVGIEGPPKFHWTFEAKKPGASVRMVDFKLENSKKVLKTIKLQEIDDDELYSWNYEGQDLEAGRKYTWQIKAWDEDGVPTPWSQNATFVTGLKESDWANAYWIGYEALPDSLKIIPGVHGSGDELGEKGKLRPVIPQFRKEFEISKEVAEAYLYISGLGHYALDFNGMPLDDRFLAPGWTLYSKTCYYNGYDLSHMLTPGSHCIGVTVGNGFFNVNRERYRKLVTAWGMPMMRLKLIIRYTDGSSEELVSNEKWKTTPSPITFSSIYGGEDFDARLSIPKWNLPGFDDSKWGNAIMVDGPGGVMKIETEHPMLIMESFKNQSITEMPDGTYVYDFGQNASGIPEIRVRGAEGRTIRFTPGELLDDEGYVTQQASGGPMYFDYTGASASLEEWKPSFTYYGFRYMAISGAVPKGNLNLDHQPVVEEIIFHHTRNSAPSVGSFSCSNELLNRIYNLINWSIRSNLASVTTDCPHREKLGWLEVPHLMGTSLQYTYDIQNLYHKIVDDMMDSQLDNGLVPDIAPEFVPFQGGFRDSPEWGSSAVILPWYLYQWYGDQETMKRAWNMMNRYVDYLDGMSNQGIVSHGLGDWFDLGQQSPGSSQLTPRALTATAIYYYDLSLLSKMAGVMGMPGEADDYRQRALKVKNAFLDQFFNSKTGLIATGSQTSYAMPLVVGLIDEEHMNLVRSKLIAAVERDEYALTAGDIGYHYLVRALQEAGADEIIWKMNARDDVPGYGYQLKLGATALTESWPALRYVSNNHMMLGHLMEWLYSGIGGIYQAEESIGYEHIVIDPKPVGDLTWAEVSHTCVRGEIYMKWEKNKEGSEVQMEFRIPVGVEAKVSFNGQFQGNYTAGSYVITIPINL